MQNKIEEMANSEKKEKLILRPSVIVLSGVPLSGKTTLAERLIGSSNLQMLDVDAIRHEIDETRKKDPQVRLLEPGKEHEAITNAYIEMCKRAENLVQQGVPVLVVGTFSKEQFKKPLEHLFSNCSGKSIHFRVFLLTVPDEEVEKRIDRRKADGSFSNIDSLDKYQWAKGFFKPIEFAPVVEINTAKSDYVEQVAENLKDLELNNK